VLEQRALRDRVPLLGICLGMQLMTRGSSEGTHAGLGWIDADTLKFEPCTGIKVPHMGWNRVELTRRAALVEDLPEEPRFYFVHSYYVRCRSREDIILSTEYGLRFDSGLQRDNIWGVQFHPEKSHTFGMQLLRNFATRCFPC
jgi:glutamine amidotransferase